MLNRSPWGPLCWVLAFFTASYQHLLWTPIHQGFPKAPSAGCGFPYHISSPTPSDLQLLCSIRRSYITFKFPRGDMDTPTSLQFLPISGDRDVSLPLSLEWPVWLSSGGNNCHAAHMSFSSGASLWSGTFPLSHIIIRAHLRDFFRLLAIGMCHFLPVHHLGIAFLGRVEGQNITREAGVQSLVDHTKDSKMVLDAALLNIQLYKVRIKGKVE